MILTFLMRHGVSLVVYGSVGAILAPSIPLGTESAAELALRTNEKLVGLFKKENLTQLRVRLLRESRETLKKNEGWYERAIALRSPQLNQSYETPHDLQELPEHD